MTEGADVYAVFLAVFERQGIDYFVTGSVASSVYGARAVASATGTTSVR